MSIKFLIREPRQSVSRIDAVSDSKKSFSDGICRYSKERNSWCYAKDLREDEQAFLLSINDELKALGKRQVELWSMADEVLDHVRKRSTD
jgi:hypothetical protein